MATLEGSYRLKYAYLAEEVERLALDQIHRVFDGFPGVEISMSGSGSDKKACVKFADREDCLFAFQRHCKIDIVPGEVEWNFRMIDGVQESARA